MSENYYSHDILERLSRLGSLVEKIKKKKELLLMVF